MTEKHAFASPERVARDRVRIGAMLLDEKRPGWHLEVDVSRLAMGWADLCVLGQLFGDYGRGREALGLSEEGGAPLHGFAAAFRIQFPAGESYGYGVLDAAWRDEIAERAA